MADRTLSRRRLRKLGAAGTATVVASCSGMLETRSEEALAVDDGTLVSGERESVEALVGVEQGERARAVEEFEPFGSLLGATQDRLVTFALYDEGGLDDLGTDGNGAGAGFAEAEGALGLASGMDISAGGEEFTAETVLEFEGLAAGREQSLRDALGTAGADADVEAEDDRVSATATDDDTDVTDTVGCPIPRILRHPGVPNICTNVQPTV